MSKKKTPAATAAADQEKRPSHGGSFVRHPETGELECVERTEPAARPTLAPAHEPESGTDQAEMSGDPPAPMSGSTAGESDQQED